MLQSFASSIVRCVFSIVFMNSICRLILSFLVYDVTFIKCTYDDDRQYILEFFPLTEKCSLKYKMERKYCTDVYSGKYEDKRDYTRAWNSYNSNISSLYGSDILEKTRENPWVYRFQSELNGHIFMSRLHTYPGGGYVRTLGTTAKEANTTLSYLKRHLWMDTFTRAVFLEFSTYNNNGNFYCIVTLVLEFNPDGGVIPYSSVITTRLDRYNNAFSIFLAVCEISFLILTHYYLWQEVKEFRKKGWSHLQEPKCLVELLIYAATWTSFAFLIIRLSVVAWLKNKYKENRDGFTNLQYAATTDSAYGYVLGTIVFVAVLKFLKVLRFNKNMLLLIETLQYAGREISNCGVFICLALVAYASWAYLAFGRVLEGYATFLRSIMSLLNLVLGNSTFKELTQANRVLAPLFFALFVVTITMILVNTFLTIVIESFTIVRMSSEYGTNRFEILQFWYSKLSAYFPCLTTKKPKRNRSKGGKGGRGGKGGKGGKRGKGTARLLQKANKWSHMLKRVSQMDDLVKKLIVSDYVVTGDLEQVRRIIAKKKSS